MDVSGRQWRCDPSGAVDFINQVELDGADEVADGEAHEDISIKDTQNAESDIDLLLEAEKRCLLDSVTSELLQRLRDAGLAERRNIPIKRSWSIHSYGYRTMFLDSGIVDLPDTTSLKDKVYETVSSMHESGITEPGIIQFSATGLHIGNPNGSAIPTIHLACTFDHGPHVFILVRVKKNKDVGPRTDIFRCYAIRCISGDEAKEVRNEIEGIRNYSPHSKRGDPVLYDLRISFNERTDFTIKEIAGAAIKDSDEGVVVYKIQDYSPASSAGLFPGMFVVNIQDTDTRMYSAEEVMTLLKSFADTGMDVTVTLLDAHSNSNDVPRLAFQPRSKLVQPNFSKAGDLQV